MIKRSAILQFSNIRSEDTTPDPVRDHGKRILVLAPTANDAAVTAQILAEARLQAEVCRDIHDLCHKINQGCAAILLAEEAIGTTSVAVLVETLGNQPSWSDIPVAIITSRGEANQTRLRRLRVFGPSGNVTLIERPFRPSTLTSTLEVVLRFRQKQYMVRDLLEESRESKQHLEFVLNAGGLGAWRLNLSTREVTWSETCKANFGLDPEEEINFDRMRQMIHPEDRGRMLQSVERAIKNGTEYQAQYRITTPQGEVRWIDSRGRIAYSEHGLPEYLSGITQNITERKAAEEALREASERTSNILASISDGLVVLDREWRFTYANKQGERILTAFGDVPEALLGKIVWEEFPQLVGTEAESNYRRAFAEQVTVKFEFYYAPLERWLDIRVYPARDSIAIYFLDVTERKQAELALRDSEARFRELADAMPQIVWSAGPDGHVDYYNKRWFEFIGLKPGASPKSWIPIVHDEDSSSCVKEWENSVKTHKPFEFECRFNDRKRGGYRWFMVRALPIKNEKGEVVRWFGTCTDIDEQKRWAEKLEQTVAQRTATLQQTIHSLETFNYSIAHDLRAPLRAMSGFSEAVLQDYKEKLDEDGREYLERIRRSAMRMDRLVSDILDYGRLAQQDIPLHSVEVEEVLAKVLNDLREEIDHRGAVVEVQRPLPTVIANVSVLNQVLLNLASNALKFAAPGIVPVLKVRTEQKDEMVRIWFEDNGIGIAPEHHGKIFEIFQQLHSNEFSGTGIGLALVKKGVERMNGMIGVESERGQGSRFWVELPGGQ